jgi:hypothetical protein
MALAPYFDKIALGAAQLLRQYSYEEFRTVLSAVNVGVAFDVSAARSSEGRVIVELCVNLLARLYPVLTLRPLAGHSDEFGDRLAQLARSINPEIEIADASDDSVRAWIVVGGTAVESANPRICVSSDRWNAIISQTPIPPGASEVPFGAAAAACVGAANMFRVVFAKHLSNAALDSAKTFSLFDGRPHAAGEAITGSIKFVDTALVGAGAIGNAALWSLARCPSLEGELHVVDAESTDVSNVQRYVLAGMADVKIPKVTLAERAFEGQNLRLVPHAEPWEALSAAQRNETRWSLVGVAVDSAAARIALQSSLPRRIVNAWTQLGEAAVSRHRRFGIDPCLACLYYPKAKGRNEAEIIATEIGLPDAAREIANMLVLKLPLTGEFLGRIAAANAMDHVALLPFEGKSLEAFRHQVVCGGALLTGEDSNVTRMEVPMAFQSAFAGVMLAAEIFLESAGARDSFDGRSAVTRLDLLRPIPAETTFAEASHPACICTDPDYLEVYASKFGVG